jgi:hypothetical protein
MGLRHVRRVLVVGALLASVAPARAELRVAAAVVDLGAIRGGQKLAHRFELVNTGSQAVEILDLERGCGCLAPQLGQRQIAPGTQADLVLELRTLGQADGPHTWNLKVHYRLGGDTKTLALALRGVVKNEISVQPAILGLHISRKVQQEITLTDIRATPLHVVEAEARAPGVQVMKIERDGKTTRILISADATQLAPGRHEGLLSITTNDADYGQLHVPIVVTKTAATSVRAAPEQIVLRLAPGAATASMVVRLRSQQDEAVRVAKIEPSDPALAATWAPGPDHDATLRVRVDGSQRPGSWQGHLEVHLAGPRTDVLMIPVIVVK